MDTEQMTLDEVMDRAADLIDEFGWTPGTYRKMSGEFCLLGALQFVARHSRAVEVRSFVEKTLGKNMIQWNDHDCVDQAEATELLRMQAKRWREEHSCLMN